MTNQITTKEIKKLSKNNTFENVTKLISSLNLELNLIQDMPFVKIWEVKNNNEINHIINTKKSLINDESIITFTFIN